jgi:hypothetical protein
MKDFSSNYKSFCDSSINLPVHKIQNFVGDVVVCHGLMQLLSAAMMNVAESILYESMYAILIYPYSLER